MLEEALKNDKCNPAEAAQLMLQFVQTQLPAGGTSAENRFFRLYVPLCDRIFGPILSKAEGYRHQDGGWLSAQSPWSRMSASSMAGTATTGASSGSSGTPTSGRVRATASHMLHPHSSSSSTTSSSSYVESDPVFKLLGTTNNPALPSLIEAISKESANRPATGFPLPFHALPKTTQDAWMALVEASCLQQMATATAATAAPGGPGQQLQQQAMLPVNSSICSRNTARLLGEMSRRRPSEQTELLEYRQYAAQQKENRNSSTTQYHPNTALSPRGLFQATTPMTTTSPGAAAVSSSSPVTASSAGGTTSKDATNKKDPKELCPKVIFGMLEYYLILFLRYPLAMPIPKTYASPAPQGQVSSSLRRSSSSSRAPYGERLYLALFRKYSNHFLPYDRDEQQSGNIRHIFFSSSDPTTRDSEFFLRATITLWMETQGRVKPTAAIIETMLQRQRRQNPQDLQLNLHSSYDLVQVLAYDPPCSLVSLCLRYLVAHVISDPALRTKVFHAGQRERDQAATASAAASSGSSPSSSSNNNNTSWSLTKAMTVLQLPFYNYVRTNLRYASIHSSDSPFYSALNIWLLWLEPWNLKEAKIHNYSARNATQRLMGSVSGQQQGQKQQSSQQRRSASVQRRLEVPKHDQPSRYHPKWEPYIAANLYLYLVPLAIFLRRARELDFSERNFQGSIKVVQRVFRVFTPQVMQVLSRHLAETSASTSPNALLQRHVRCLDIHAPPNALGGTSPPLSMASCQGDMICLLEEIQMQHLKKVRELDIFERTSAYLEGLFGKGVVSGEEKTLESLVERARLIVNLPLDYDLGGISSSSKTDARAGLASSASEMDNKRPATTKDGYLTELGKCQLVTGAVKCNPADVTFHGDTSKARATSHELAILLQWSTWASDWIYTKTNVRVELRFFADYRNLLFVSLLVSILFKVLRYKFAG